MGMVVPSPGTFFIGYARVTGFSVGPIKGQRIGLVPE